MDCLGIRAVGCLTNFSTSNRYRMEQTEMKQTSHHAPPDLLFTACSYTVESAPGAGPVYHTATAVTTLNFGGVVTRSDVFAEPAKPGETGRRMFCPTLMAMPTFCSWNRSRRYQSKVYRATWSYRQPVPLGKICSTVHSLPPRQRYSGEM